MVTACNHHKSKTPDEWSEKELQDWYSKGEWKKGWATIPNKMVNKKEFAHLYYENQVRWNKAFQLLVNRIWQSWKKEGRSLKTPIFW